MTLQSSKTKEPFTMIQNKSNIDTKKNKIDVNWNQYELIYCLIFL